MQIMLIVLRKREAILHDESFKLAENLFILQKEIMCFKFYFIYSDITFIS